MPDDDLVVPEETPGAKAEGRHAWEGQCGDCGFLCHEWKQGYSPMANWTEIETIPRVQGAVFQFGDFLPDRSRDLAAVPACFIHLASILQEIKDLGKGSIPRTQNELEVLAKQAIWNKNRNCPKWFNYMPGQSPAKHFERKEMLELEEARQANALKIAELQQQSASAMLQLMEAQKEIAEATRLVAADHKAISEDHKISFSAQ